MPDLKGIPIPSTSNPWVNLAIQVAATELPDLIKWFMSRGTVQSAMTAQQIADIAVYVHQVDATVQADVQKALKGE